MLQSTASESRNNTAPTANTIIAVLPVRIAAMIEMTVVAARKNLYILTIFLYLPYSTLINFPASVFTTAITAETATPISTHHQVSLFNQIIAPQ